MRDLATQAYISYLHEIVKAHEEIQEQQNKMIKLLEQQINHLSRQIELEHGVRFRSPYDTEWNNDQG